MWKSTLNNTGATDKSDKELMPIFCKERAPGNLLREDVCDQLLDGASKFLRACMNVHITLVIQNSYNMLMIAKSDRAF